MKRVLGSVYAAEVLFQLLHGTGTDEYTRDTVLLQYPAQRMFGEGLTGGFRLRIPRLQLLEEFGCQPLSLQVEVSRHARIVGYAVQITVGEEPLCERRKGYEADAVGGTEVGDARLLRFLVYHVEPSLVY